LSVDPLASSYAYYSPYQFAGNSPVLYIDLDGLERAKWWTGTLLDNDAIERDPLGAFDETGKKVGRFLERLISEGDVKADVSTDPNFKSNSDLVLTDDGNVGGGGSVDSDVGTHDEDASFFNKGVSGKGPSIKKIGDLDNSDPVRVVENSVKTVMNLKKVVEAAVDEFSSDDKGVGSTEGNGPIDLGDGRGVYDNGAGGKDTLIKNKQGYLVPAKSKKSSGGGNKKKSSIPNVVNGKKNNTSG